jgi:hypothetical protein
LGVVIYWLKEEESGKFELEAMPLDFVQLSQRHTGKYLAQTIQLVVEKFNIQNQVGLVVLFKWSLPSLTKLIN